MINKKFVFVPLFFLLTILPLVANGEQNNQSFSGVKTPVNEISAKPTSLVYNNSLKIYITPTQYSDRFWEYKVEWSRKLAKKGSLYITRNAVNAKPTVVFSSVAAMDSATTGLTLEPNKRYKLEFYSKENKQGTLLARKYFTTLKFPQAIVACTMDVKECPDGSSVGRIGPNCEFAVCPLMGAELKSKFFKDEAQAKKIVSGEIQNYKITEMDFSLGYVQKENTNNLAYRVISGIRQLGYAQYRQERGLESGVLLLKKFQKFNNLPQNEIVSKDVLLRLDAALLKKEADDLKRAKDFPLYPFMPDAPLNEPSKEHLAALFTSVFRSLPAHLVVWDTSFKWFPYYQLSGTIGPKPGKGWYDIVNDDYQLCVGYYYSESQDNCKWLNSIAIFNDDFDTASLLLHEYAHFLDKNIFTPEEGYGARGKIDTTNFYKISFDTSQPKTATASTWTFYPLRRGEKAVATEMVSSYSYGWTNDNFAEKEVYRTPYEDFAEAFALYVTGGEVFRVLAKNNIYLQEKYNWLKTNVFGNWEYRTGNMNSLKILREKPVGSYGNLVFNVIDYFWSDPDYIFSYEFPRF